MNTKGGQTCGNSIKYLVKINYCFFFYPQGHKVNGIWNEIEYMCRTIDTIEYSNHDLRELAPDTYYRVELRAHNAIGFSTPSNFLLKTARGESISPGTNVYKANFEGVWTSASSQLSAHSFISLTICAQFYLAVLCSLYY